ncbi:putative F-box/LRR-repeat protein At3g28410 [Ricinus communis]|uniref:Uncharacterized protein n=1 Tax=Ricinus communis TaxID=3988 RepID=B9RW69_RICCO|nr:putative F-box/LRR-repeat protein At3g28410 [Ricinus communis]EEF44506.1 hypothetical protein RCOM_1176360 [Ricinus communis]|eukprot:XP_002517988.1 putative F-box/LRR-repeat protein At3g28410 [Ricinus communis]
MLVPMENVEDLLSELHEPILHHIMSFLPSKDAVRTSVLSTKFKYSWQSCPTIDFKLKGYGTDEFLSNVHDFIGRRTLGTAIGKLKLRVPSYSETSNNRLDAVIDYAIQNFVKEVDLDFRNDIPQLYPTMKDLYFSYYPLPSRVLASKSITILKLKGFKMAPRDLILTSSVLRYLSLEHCTGMESLKVFCDQLSLIHVESCVGPKQIELVTPYLETFYFIGEEGSQLELSEDTFSTCKSLKHLNLDRVKITDQWLENLVSEDFAFLENVRLSGCNTLKKLMISHSNLKYFELDQCSEQLEEVEIDARKLDTFACGINYGAVMDKQPICLPIHSPLVKVILLLDTSSTTSNWFSFLRDVLSFLGHCRELKLVCKSEEDLIVPEDMRGSLLSPLHDLRNLKVEINNPISQLPDFVGSLLWLAPHPDTVTIVCDSEEKSLKFKYSLVKNEVKDVFCCHLKPILCWRHNLKELTMENFTCLETRIMHKFFKVQDMRLETIHSTNKSKRKRPKHEAEEFCIY